MAQVKLHVELLRYTKDADEIVAMGGKMCYSASDIDTIAQGVATKDQSRYIERLMGMGHTSVIEHASFTFGIEGVSRALLAQIARHRIASFSVQSQRYVGQRRDEGTFNYIMPPRIAALGPEAQQRFNDQMAQIQSWYNEWVDALGNAGEQSNEDARFVMPNAAETKIMMTMNARELMHFFSLRCCNRAQWEIRELAWQMLEKCMEVAPRLFANAGPGCVRGACPEGKKSCGQAGQVCLRQAALRDKNNA